MQEAQESDGWRQQLQHWSLPVSAWVLLWLEAELAFKSANTCLASDISQWLWPWLYQTRYLAFCVNSPFYSIVHITEFVLNNWQYGTHYRVQSAQYRMLYITPISILYIKLGIVLFNNPQEPAQKVNFVFV